MNWTGKIAEACTNSHLDYETIAEYLQGPIHSSKETSLEFENSTEVGRPGEAADVIMLVVYIFRPRSYGQHNEDAKDVFEHSQHERILNLST